MCLYHNLNNLIPLFFSVQQKKTRIDFQNKSKKEKKDWGKKKKHIMPPGKIHNLSHPCMKVSPTEVVARLLEHEALTALPKANFNLFQWNGIGDVWWISHCL